MTTEETNVFIGPHFLNVPYYHDIYDQLAPVALRNESVPSEVRIPWGKSWYEIYKMLKGRVSVFICREIASVVLMAYKKNPREFKADEFIEHDNTDAYGVKTRVYRVYIADRVNKETGRAYCMGLDDYVPDVFVVTRMMGDEVWYYV